MTRSLDVLLSLLKYSPCNLTQLAQIFAQTITTGLIQRTILWNSIIRAYSKSSSPMKATLIYNHFIKESSIFPDNHTFPALFRACSRLHSLPKGKEIHAHVVKLGLLYSDVYILNSVVHFYGCLGQVKDARRLFDEMRQRDLVSWNSMLGTYSGSAGLCVEALVLFKEMLFVGVGADEITMVILLSACSSVKEIECGKAIHSYAIKVGIRCSLNLENSLLGLYCKGGEMSTAHRLFLQMGNDRRDVTSCTVLINGYVELGLLDQAREIFDQIIVGDIVSWNSMIHGYVKAKRHEEAIELFEKMEKDGPSPDENTIVSLLTACASLSDLQFGRLVHQIIFQRNIRVDVFVGTALVNMYAKCGSLEEAMTVFNRLEYKDIFAWTVVISALANYGCGNEALALFRQMEKEGTKPNEATFVAVLMACSHSGLVDEGCQLFDRMLAGAYDIQLMVEHFGCIVDLLSRAGLLCRAEQFIRTMPEEERIVAYKTLLSACLSYSDIDVGENVAKELIKLGSHSHGVYVLLSNFYASANCWDKVTEIRRIMKEIDMRKEAGISFIETNNIK